MNLYTVNYSWLSNDGRQCAIKSLYFVGENAPSIALMEESKNKTGFSEMLGNTVYVGPYLVKSIPC
jgi:hypothetical protein